MKTKKEIKLFIESHHPITNDIKISGYSQEVVIDFIQYFLTQCQQDSTEVTRLEVIDEKGRVYTRHDCNIELSYQDDNRTLKVFIKPNIKTNEST